jgi:hypothetical protein
MDVEAHMPGAFRLTTHKQVSDRLEAAVSQALDDGLRTGDIFKEGYPGTRKVKCSEISEHLLRIVNSA